MDRQRLQSAMEYLITYGWAILIIVVVLAALFYLGVFNPSTFAARAQPGACSVYRPNGVGTTSFINLEGTCNGEIPEFVAKFNGQGSLVSMGTTGELNAYPLTVTAWVSTQQSTSGGAGIISKYYASSANGYQLLLNGGKLYAWYYSSYSNSIGQFGGTAINNGEWQFIALTVNSSGGYLYVDGQLKSTNPWSGAASAATTNTALVFGTAPGGATNPYFGGSISNIQVYNASLSANEVQALYLEGIGGPPINLPHLAGWWPLNGNADDYSGNGYNGTANSIAYTSGWTGTYASP